MPTWLTKLLATGFYTGYSPTVAGTVGTIPAWLIAWFLLGQNQLVLGIAAVVMYFVSVWVSGYAEDIYGHDAKKIVIDEWAGMFITVVLVPHTLTAYAIAFVAFRATDALKPPPAAQAEKLPRGWGITSDDAVAAVQANIITQLVLWVFGLR